MDRPSDGGQLLITLAETPDQQIAFLRLVGDVDLACEPALADACQQLTQRPAELLYIDLAAVAFAGSSLLHFLFDLAAAGSFSVVLCRPSAWTLQLIELMGVHEVTSVRAEVELDWAVPHAVSGVSVTGIRTVARV